MADPFASARDVGDLFEAAYDSELDCGCYVREGDLIGYVDGELMCMDCRGDALRT